MQSSVRGLGETEMANPILSINKLTIHENSNTKRVRSLSTYINHKLQMVSSDAPVEEELSSVPGSPVVPLTIAKAYL